MTQQTIFFASLVFLAAFLLTMSLSTSVFGENRQARKRLKARISGIGSNPDESTGAVLLRKDHLQGLQGWERRLESLPVLGDLQLVIKQSGHKILAYRLILLSIILALGASFICWTLTYMVAPTLILMGIAGAIPYLKIRIDRGKRLDAFEEQLPDAIDAMKRALQAGYPFNETLNLVAKELPEPISSEFGETFAELNYGSDYKAALLNLLGRVPSVNVMALVTSILVQKESGGNLVEILNKIGSLIRQRFKFHRRIKTLSAEGRLSAWVLAMVPFVLFGILWFSSPGYLDPLFIEPTGHKMLLGAGIGMCIGIYWISRIIRIEV